MASSGAASVAIPADLSSAPSQSWFDMPPGVKARLAATVGVPPEDVQEGTSGTEDGDADPEGDVGTGGEYRCNLCEKCFAVPARLTRHYRIHTGEKPFRCDECGKCFSVKENLSVHRRTHTKERPYKCEYCYRAFEHSGKLHRHLRIHTGERPHRCSDCGKTFIQSGQLVIHLRTHTGEKPYVCTVCSKGFTCSKQLKVHHRTHTGEKPYVCPICGKAFGYNHVLKLHQMQHFGEKLYKCVLCFETLTSKKALETHLRQHKDTPPSRCSTSPSSQLAKNPAASTSWNRPVPSPTGSADTSTSDSAQSSLSGQDDGEIMDLKKRRTPTPALLANNPPMTSSGPLFGANSSSVRNYQNHMALPGPELRFQHLQHPSQSYPWLSRPLPPLLPLPTTPQLIQRPTEEDLISWSRVVSLQQYASQFQNQHHQQQQQHHLGVAVPGTCPKPALLALAPPRKRFRPLAVDSAPVATGSCSSFPLDQRLFPYNPRSGGSSSSSSNPCPLAPLPQQVNLNSRLPAVVDIDLESVRLRSVIQFAHRVTAGQSHEARSGIHGTMSAPASSSASASPQLRNYLSQPDSHHTRTRSASYSPGRPPL